MTRSRKGSGTTEADVLAETEAQLDQLDPAVLASATTDASDLRRIGEAAEAIDSARDTLAAAVTLARANGRSWGQIGMVLGVTKQAARERFGTRSMKRV